MTTRSCDGCLGNERCWICAGEGCQRCGRTGRCHVCLPSALGPARPEVALPAGRRPDLCESPRAASGLRSVPQDVSR